MSFHQKPIFECQLRSESYLPPQPVALITFFAGALSFSSGYSWCGRIFSRRKKACMRTSWSVDLRTGQDNRRNKIRRAIIRQYQSVTIAGPSSPSFPLFFLVHCSTYAGHHVPLIFRAGQVNLSWTLVVTCIYRAHGDVCDICADERIGLFRKAISQKISSAE